MTVKSGLEQARRLMLAALLVLGVCACASAAAPCVAVDEARGNDTAACGGAAAPCASLAYAVAQCSAAAAAGGVCCAAGDYTLPAADAVHAPLRIAGVGQTTRVRTPGQWSGKHALRVHAAALLLRGAAQRLSVPSLALSGAGAALLVDNGARARVGALELRGVRAPTASAFVLPPLAVRNASVLYAGALAVRNSSARNSALVHAGAFAHATFERVDVREPPSDAGAQQRVFAASGGAQLKLFGGFVTSNGTALGSLFDASAASITAQNLLVARAAQPLVSARAGASVQLRHVRVFEARVRNATGAAALVSLERAELELRESVLARTDGALRCVNASIAVDGASLLQHSNLTLACGAPPASCKLFAPPGSSFPTQCP